MTGRGGAFAVDLEELLDAVSEMAACESALGALLDDLARQVRTLHLTWEGLAATAQASAQQEWESGYRDMREALDRMRWAAGVAHDNYRGAATTNVRMWEQVV